MAGVEHHRDFGRRGREAELLETVPQLRPARVRQPCDREAEALKGCADVVGVVERVREARRVGIRGIPDHQRHALTGQGRRQKRRYKQQRGRKSNPPRAPPLDPKRGKEVRAHGVSVRAIRKPSVVGETDIKLGGGYRRGPPNARHVGGMKSRKRRREVRVCCTVSLLQIHVRARPTGASDIAVIPAVLY